VSCRQGAKLAVDKDRWSKFTEMGMEPTLEAEEAIERANVIIDCTPVGNENKEKIYKRYSDNGRGFIAQGSEYGFGKMYARGINDKALKKGEDKFIQVVSCNTHNLAVLIDTRAGKGGQPRSKPVRMHAAGQRHQPGRRFHSSSGSEQARR
jgi:glyceraldehyde-3-phosphate dehydrogenase (NAD(P))